MPQFPEKTPTLEASVKGYVAHHIRDGLMSPRADEAKLAIDRAKGFDEQLAKKSSSFPPGERRQIASLLEFINKGTERPTPEGVNFTETIRGHYIALKRQLEVVVNKVRSRGVDYLMYQSPTGDCFSAEASADMELLSRMFFLASGALEDELCSRSSDYEKIRASWKRRMAEDIIRFGDYSESEIAAWQRRTIIERILHIPNAATNGTPVELRAHDFMRATNDLLEYLGESHGKKGLVWLESKPSGRPIKSLDSFPIMQLEKMLELLNAMLRDYKECVILHGGLLVEPK